MPEDLIQRPATEMVAMLKRKEVTPVEVVEAAARRIAEVEPVIHALPTLCIERARDRARRLMDRPAEDGGVRGWLAGLPIAIKDTTDVEGVRTTYGSTIFRDHVPRRSNALVERLEGLGGIVIGKSNTPEFGVGGNTRNKVFGPTLNPWNTALTPGGSSGGAAAAVATGEVWLAHGTDHGGSLRRPAAYCSVVALRCSPGRVTRGAPNGLWSAQAVHGPIARNVADLALFLDAMAGPCRHDPMTFDAPASSYSDLILRPPPAARVAFTADFNGKVPVDRETRELCACMARRFEDAGWQVEEASPEIGDAAGAFAVLRSLSFLIDREYLLEEHRDSLGPDLLAALERGRSLTAARLSWAERERAALYRRFQEFFETFQFLISPAASTPPFDVDLRFPSSIDGLMLEDGSSAQLMNAIITLSASPCAAVPCGFDRHGRPVGLQITGRTRDEAGVLQAAACFEELIGLHRLLPIDPRAGSVPAVA
jgi:amidase